MPLFINKHLGETPLEALERFRAGKIAAGEKYQGQSFEGLPMTYAGRLDPMAEGLLVLLVGEECKQKDAYLGLDKVYETEFLLGVETDTHDVLGLVQHISSSLASQISGGQFETVLRTFLGKRTQTYPAYSSKPHNGRPLFELARAGELPSEDEMPSREVEIYKIELVGERTLVASELEKQILEKIALVKGDFRQAEICAKWQVFFESNRDGRFQLFSLRIHCSSGTYIRSLAHEVGKRLGANVGCSGVGATAFSIKRTQVGEFSLSASPMPISPLQNP